MPRRVKSWQAIKRRAKHSDENRPNANARGYCSAAWLKTRKLVIARDGGICQMCGCIVTEMAQIDHIIEKGTKGSTEALSNLRLLCLPCHSSRHSQQH